VTSLHPTAAFEASWRVVRTIFSCHVIIGRRRWSCLLCVLPVLLATAAVSVGFGFVDSAAARGEGSERARLSRQASRIALTDATLDGSVAGKGRQCVTQLFARNRQLARAIVSTSSLGRLSEADQLDIMHFVSMCAPTALGQATFQRFLQLTNPATTHIALDDSQYHCIAQQPGASGYDGSTTARALFSATHDRPMAVQEMTTSALVLFRCAGNFMASGPLAEKLQITPASAACVTGQLVHFAGLWAETASMIFRASPTQPSAALQEIVARC
jgi:hypothetical protein